jgi:putative hydrolase of the HAD superfamily
MNILQPIKNIKYIFFDIYGTLAGFYPEREKIQKKILKKNGIFLSEDQITFGYKFADEYMAFQKKNKPLRKLTNYEKKDFFSNYQSKIIEANKISIDKNLAWKIWQEISKEEYELRIFDDVIDNLKWLSDLGLRVAGITNMDIKGDVLMKNLGIEDFLEFVLTSLESGSEKPDSKIFLDSIGRANIKPNESIYVGDQIESDYLGSQKIGMIPVLIDRYKYYEDFSGIKIKNLDEIKKLF